MQTRIARMRKSDDALVLGFLQTEMGKEALAAGRRDAAEAAFRTALSLDRRVFPAHLALADLWLERDPRRAAQVLEDAIAAVPERAYLAFSTLQRAYAACGEPSRFAALCERLVGQDPRDWRARLGLARQLRAEDRPGEALGLLLRAVEANPHVLLVHLEVWRTLRALGAARARRAEVRGDRRGVGALRRPAHLHRLPLPRRRHALALPALPRVEHARRGAGRTRGGNAVRRARALACWPGRCWRRRSWRGRSRTACRSPTVLVFWATVLGQVVLPGVLLVRGARLRAAERRLARRRPGCDASASRCRGSRFLAGRALGAPWLTDARGARGSGGRPGARSTPLARPRPRDRGGAAPASPASTLAVALAAVLLQPLASAERLGEAVPFDLLFHAGTAAELRHRWPLQDPRVAGVPLHYHVLAYALPIEAADRAAAPLADPLLRARPALLGRPAGAADGERRPGALRRRAAPVSLGAAVALFHADPGARPRPRSGCLQQPPRDRDLRKPDDGLQPRPARRPRARARGLARDAAAGASSPCSALLAAAASGAKTTVLPVVLGGLALCAAWAFARHAGRRVAALGWRLPRSWPPPARRSRCGRSLGPSSYSADGALRRRDRFHELGLRGRGREPARRGRSLGPRRAAALPALARGLPRASRGSAAASGSPAGASA